MTILFLLTTIVASLLMMSVVVQVQQTVKAMSNDDIKLYYQMWTTAFFGVCQAEAGKQVNEASPNQLHDVCPKAYDNFVNCKSLAGDGSDLIGLVGDACRAVAKVNNQK